MFEHITNYRKYRSKTNQKKPSHRVLIRIKILQVVSAYSMLRAFKIGLRGEGTRRKVQWLG